MPAAKRCPPKTPFPRQCSAALAGVVLLGFLGASQAETLKIATGDYPPFVAQHLPMYGVTAAIVTAAFQAQQVDVAYTFLPWKRGYLETSQGRFAGTFPYLQTAERQSDFFYSEPIFDDVFRLFVRQFDQQNQAWRGKRICIPLGYDTTQLQAFIASNQIQLEQPAEISNCFHMLESKRVDAVWVSELVGITTVKTLFGPHATIYPLEYSLVGRVHYYFIVPKKLVNAQQVLARFNAGLKLIQNNGSYSQIVQNFSDITIVNTNK